ncbi:MAG: DUF58 domain-containing protein [Opitutaceae bacterium]|jgi:uncharacterized protein (DUF58 family)|nr:DUF58 domain-containing protein [Opitutaceae bacterium]
MRLKLRPPPAFLGGVPVVGDRPASATPPPLHGSRPPGNDSRLRDIPPPIPRQSPAGGAPRPLPLHLRTRATIRLHPEPPESKLLRVAELERFKNLLLFAKATVDGFFAGKHRSPHPGASSEFRDYKNYVPGDSVDHLDWRAWGRTRRLYIRRYEDETDMAAWLLVDTSASMNYAGPGRPPKYEHAARIAAALAWLMLRQGDKAALGLFADRLKTFHPPGGTRRHLHEIVTTLEHALPASTTGLAASLEQAASVFKKRGRLVVLSDFLAEPAPLFDALGRFRHRGFQVLLLQILDPDELDLPDHSAARYVDMENGQALEIDTADIRADYRIKIRSAIDTLAAAAAARGIEHQLVNTREPCATALEAWLGFRTRTRTAAAPASGRRRH